MRDKQEYLDTACDQIRFKAARKTLRQELAAHIEDKKDSFETTNVQDAEAKAVEAMGDAVETGKALDAIHKPRTEWGVIASVVLLSIAVIVLLALDGASHRYFTQYQFYKRQLVGVAAGLCIMLGMMFFDYTWLLRLRHVMYSAFVLLYIPHRLLSESLINGVYYPGSSLGVFIQTMIPMLFLLGIAGYIHHNKGKSFFGLAKIILLSMTSYILPLILFGSVAFRTHQLISLILICVVLRRSHFTSKRRGLQYLIVFGSIAVAVLIQFFVVSPDRWFADLMSRFPIGANIENHPILELRSMLQSAKLIGPSDYWLSQQTLFHSHSSYMLTCIIGIYGWLAGIGIIAVFGTLFIMLFIRIKKIVHPFGKILALTAIMFLLFKCVITFMMSLGIVHGPDLNMPFISFGRIDYIVNAAMLGIFLSVWRRSSYMHQDLCDKTSGIFSRRLKN